MKTKNTIDEPLFAISYYTSNDNIVHLVNYNSRFNHGVPMIINWSNNAILKGILGSGAPTITHGNFPLVSTLESKSRGNGSTFYMWIFLIMGLSLIPTSSIVFIIKEREQNSKQQQFVAGVSLFSYWLSNFLWDWVKYMINVLLFMVLLELWGPEFLTSTEWGQLWVVLLLFLSFGYMSFMFIYMMSFLFNKLLYAMIFTLTWFFAFGIVE